ncbi:unnamed protein product [Arctia plantaginis]|uniref:Peptidase S1 domain-containing protein n=1 Tax=Arctia plantaginis TaxID=874455 RepID=A0A8S0ZQR7_ARCPL|nr:unnamed protein product [Arctia plantaginis]
MIISTLMCIYLQFVFGVQSTRGIFGLGYGFQRVCFCRCGVTNGNSGNTRTGRVSGEWYISPHEYPWLVAINIGPQVIAGSLISDSHILTAASPLYGLTPDRLTVTLGAHDRCAVGGSALNVSVESIILRSGYSPKSLENNLALVKLQHAVVFSQYISPICLPFLGTRYGEQLTWIAGWSPINVSCTPHVAILPTLPTAACLQEAGNNLSRNDKGCLGPLSFQNGTCKNDVGSPVMVRWSSNASLRLAGVLTKSSCDITTSSLYTRVVDYIGWIHEHIRRDCQCI